MQGFKSPEQAEHFLDVFSAMCNHFRPRRHHLSAGHYREIMHTRFVSGGMMCMP
jgi:putative transposase